MKGSGFTGFINHDSVFLSLCMLAGLWGLVNNAAILSFCPIEWTPVSTFKRLAEVISGEWLTSLKHFYR